jgi:hypothetical protein
MDRMRFWNIHLGETTTERCAVARLGDWYAFDTE